jgi:hypothetical protein
MKKSLPETLSITEVIRHIFPYMTARTIQLWIEKGIFMPETYVPKPSGRSRGCRLSVADMVTIGILHSLFALGATFHEIQDSREIIQENPMHFEGLGFGWTPYKQDEFMAQGRPIQRYLEQIGYDCLVLYQPMHVKTYLRDQNTIKDRVQANVIFFPATDDYGFYMNRFRHAHWNRRSDNDVEEPKSRYQTSHPVAYAYINVRDWYEVVREGLAAI